MHFPPSWPPAEPHFVLNKSASLGERTKPSLDYERRIDAKVIRILIFRAAITVQISGPLRAELIVSANIVIAIADLMRYIVHP